MAEADRARADIATVELYGVDHSPWVHAVLLGLYDKEMHSTSAPSQHAKCSPARAC